MTLSAIVLRIFIVEYIIIMIIFFFERDYARALYFICAAGIGVSVLWMK